MRGEVRAAAVGRASAEGMCHGGFDRLQIGVSRALRLRSYGGGSLKGRLVCGFETWRR